MSKWKCDGCAEAEGGSGLPCTLTSDLQPDMTKCPVSGEECEWEKCPGLSAENLVKQMCDYLDGGSMDLGHKKEPVNKICSGSLFHDMMAEFKA